MPGHPTINQKRTILPGQCVTTGTLDTADIADGAVISPKIGSSAVGSTGIASGAVISPKLGASAVGGTALASSAVSTAKIASTAVISPKIGTSAVGSTHIASNAVTSAKVANDNILERHMGASAVGLTAAADCIQRNVAYISLGVTPATGGTFVVFRGPPSGATVKGAYVYPGSTQNHAVNEADTWIFALRNKTTGNALTAQNPSLSGVTLAATAAMTFPLNAGNSTVLSGHTLVVSSSISGSPAAMQSPLVVLEWVPTTNA